VGERPAMNTRAGLARTGKHWDLILSIKLAFF
jgi:hypothetical protein